MELAGGFQGSARGRSVLLAAPVAVFLFSTIALLRDLSTDRYGSGDGVVVGSVRDAVGDVKRRPSNRFRWFEVSQKAQIYDHDSIRTTGNSQVQVDLPHDGALKIDENSLVVVERLGDVTAVKLMTGDLDFEAGKEPLLLQSGGFQIDASAAVGSVSSNNGIAAVEVKSGRVSVVRDGESKKLGAGQRADLLPAGKVAVTGIPAFLHTPLQGARFLTDAYPSSGDATALVLFRWESGRRAKELLRLEISNTRDFSKPLEAVGNSFGTAAARLVAGTYYWRVRDPSRSIESVSENRSFEVVNKLPIRLLDPPDGKSIPYSNPPHQIEFSWIGPAYYDHFTLELAREPEFRQVISRHDMGDRSDAVLELSGPGHFFWRVQAGSADLKSSETSAARDFVLASAPETRQTPAVAVPKPLVPVPAAPPSRVHNAKTDAGRRRTRGYEIKIASPSLQSGAGSDATSGGIKKDTVVLNWSGIRGATKYRVSISVSPKMRRPFIDAEVSAPSYALPISRFAGKDIYYRISARLAGGTVAESMIETFSSKLAPPRLVSPADGQLVFWKKLSHDESQADLLLTWARGDIADRYRLEVARDRDFHRLYFSKEIEDNFCIIPMPAAGAYWWRVSGVLGEKDGPRSQPYKLVLRK